MKKNWQISYIVEGLPAPEEGIVCNKDILIKCGETTNEAVVFIKITEEEKDSQRFPKKTVIEGILQLYALETKRHANIAYSSGYLKSPINEKLPFGQRPIGRIPIEVAYTPEQLKELYSAFEFAAKEYGAVRRIFQNSSMTFLRNALKYYYTALGENDIQKTVIDLFVALESLFSKEILELRYRVSLRTSSFLGFIGMERKKVYERVYDLYKKRSKIVHGVEKVGVSWEEVYELEEYLRACCRVFIYLDKGKDDIIRMLDATMYDNDVKQELQKIILAAYNKWKTSGFRIGIDLPRHSGVEFSLDFIPENKRIQVGAHITSRRHYFCPQ